MNAPIPILLFAAGLGTRMGDLVKDRPKPLVEVAGKPLIDHALALTRVDGVGKRVVNIHHQAEKLRHHLKGQDIAFSDETDMLRETGGGLRHALPVLGVSPVITMNTDAIWRGPNPVSTILNAWQPHMEALLLTVPQPQVTGHLGKGDFTRDENGHLHRGRGDIYSGLQIIRTETLAQISEAVFSMNVIWDQMAARGGLYGVSYPGQWCDVGQPASIPLAEALLDV